MKITALVTKMTSIPPVITQDWLDKYMKDWIMSSEKAIQKLGFKITPFETVVAETIQWLKSDY